MTRRLALPWMRSLLPLLLLRLLVPTGLMLAPGEHGAQLVLCSMESPQGRDAVDAGAAQDAAMNMNAMDMNAMDMDASAMTMDSAAALTAHPMPAHPDAHRDTVCPFAAVASSAPVPTQPPLARGQATLALLVLQHVEAQGPARSGPLRSQISRAPPALS